MNTWKFVTIGSIAISGIFYGAAGIAKAGIETEPKRTLFYEDENVKIYRVEHDGEVVHYTAPQSASYRILK